MRDDGKSVFKWPVTDSGIVGFKIGGDRSKSRSQTVQVTSPAKTPNGAEDLNLSVKLR